MESIGAALKQHFWPISAMIFCPCHLPLSMAALASLSAGTALGGLISANYTAIESVLAVLFSFYFVLAFMIWAVRGPRRADGETCEVAPGADPAQPDGLSMRQILLWGILGMLAMPLLIAASLFVRSDLLGELATSLRGADFAGSGLIWLVSLSTVVMIPVMIIWLAWMWIAWSRTDPAQAESESWSYEYDYD